MHINRRGEQIIKDYNKPNHHQAAQNNFSKIHFFFPIHATPFLKFTLACLVGTGPVYPGALALMIKLLPTLRYLVDDFTFVSSERSPLL